MITRAQSLKKDKTPSISIDKYISWNIIGVNNKGAFDRLINLKKQHQISMVII